MWCAHPMHGNIHRKQDVAAGQPYVHQTRLMTNSKHCTECRASMGPAPPTICRSPCCGDALIETDVFHIHACMSDEPSTKVIRHILPAVGEPNVFHAASALLHTSYFQTICKATWSTIDLGSYIHSVVEEQFENPSSRFVSIMMDTLIKAKLGVSLDTDESSEMGIAR